MVTIQSSLLIWTQISDFLRYARAFPYSPYPPTGTTVNPMQQALDVPLQHQNKIISQALADASQQYSQIQLSQSLKGGQHADIIVQTTVDDRAS